jgi:hypothetical protein
MSPLRKAIQPYEAQYRMSRTRQSVLKILTRGRGGLGLIPVILLSRVLNAKNA